MLGPYYKLVVQNNTGEQIDATNITARIRKFKHDKEGQLTFSDEVTLAGDNATLADAGYDDLGAAVTNTTDGYTGLIGTLEYDLSGETGPDGTIDCYVKISSDGTNYPDDDLQDLIHIGSCVFDGTAEDNHAQLHHV